MAMDDYDKKLRLEERLRKKLSQSGFKYLRKQPAETTARQRIDLLKDRYLTEEYGKLVSAEGIMRSFVSTFNDYSLISDRARAVFTRDVKRDSYGKPDLRKVQRSMLRLMKSEGIGSWDYVSHEVVWCVSFAQLEIAELAPTDPSSFAKGQAYEIACLEALKALSTDVNLTVPGADFGADIVFSLQELRCVAQCKNLNKPAGVRAVQEISAARDHYGATIAVVFSRHGFSTPAEELAISNRVALVDGLDISSLVRQVPALRAAA